MKKTIISALVAAMILAGCTANSGNSDNNDKVSSVNGTETTAVTVTAGESDTVLETENVSDTENPDNSYIYTETEIGSNGEIIYYVQTDKIQDNNVNDAPSQEHDNSNNGNSNNGSETTNTASTKKPSNTTNKKPNNTTDKKPSIAETTSNIKKPSTSSTTTAKKPASPETTSSIKKPEKPATTTTKKTSKVTVELPDLNDVVITDEVTLPPAGITVDENDDVYNIFHLGKYKSTGTTNLKITGISVYSNSKPGIKGLQSFESGDTLLVNLNCNPNAVFNSVLYIVHEDIKHKSTYSEREYIYMCDMYTAHKTGDNSIMIEVELPDSIISSNYDLRFVCGNEEGYITFHLGG